MVGEVVGVGDNVGVDVAVDVAEAVQVAVGELVTVWLGGRVMVAWIGDGLGDGDPVGAGLHPHRPNNTRHAQNPH